MKRTLFYSRLLRHPAFTLVELLVVIAIIAILAAVTAGVGNAVIIAAKKAKALNNAVQIQTACIGYYTEYSVYPAPPTSGDYLLTDVSGSAGAWATIMCILCGNIHPSSPGTAFTTAGATITNSRGIAFLTMKASDVGAYGSANQDAPLNPLTYPGTTNLFFNIAIDTDYDGLLGTTGNTSGKLPNFGKTPYDYTGTSTAGVALWEYCSATAPSAAVTNSSYWIHTY